MSTKAERKYTDSNKERDKYENSDRKPDGTPRKQLDVSKLHKLGWKHGIELQEGIEKTYQWYLDNLAKT